MIWLIITSMALCAFLSTLMAGKTYSSEKSPYMGGPVETVTLPNGAVANKQMIELIAKTVPLEPKTVKVTDGVWSLEGYAFVNCAVIEGKTGLIVYDTGDDVKDKLLSHPEVKAGDAKQARPFWPCSTNTMPRSLI